MKRRLKVVIVEDELLLADDLRSRCEEFGAEVLGIARNAGEAANRFAGLRPDMLLTDFDLGPGGDGADVARALRRRLPSLRVVFVTGSTDERAMRRMAEISPDHILIKPIGQEELREALT